MNTNKLAILMVLIVSVAGFVGASAAASSVTQTATVTVSPVIALIGPDTLDFGTVADSTYGPTPLSVTNTLTDASNMPIDVYTRANSNQMVSTDAGVSDVITPVQFTPNGGSATSFTTAYQMAYSNWLKPAQGGSPATWGEGLNIIVPSYTNNGTYTVTIYNAAVAHGAVAPTTP